jgi:hypothetical protein
MALVLVGTAAHVAAQTRTVCRVFGRIIDGATSAGISNVEVQLYYVPLASTTNDLTVLIATNTDVNGNYSFDALPGELEGQVRVLQLPTGYFAPMKETVRLSALNPTNQVIFRASPAAVLTGSVVVASGTADFTKFTIEVSAIETDVAANGTFLIPELPAYQQTARLIYQDGHYFDERVISLPAMAPGQTNSLQILCHQPMQNLTLSGKLRDVNGNVLTNALIQFLGQTTGVFVGMQTDANGNYAINDLPADCYMVRAFIGRWGVEQATLSTSDSILCAGNGGGSTVGDGIPDWWRQWYFERGTTTNDLSCASCDPDGDGLSNLQEFLRSTDPTNSASANITLYANSLVGNNSFDGYAPAVMNGHGPKLNIQAGIAASLSGDSVQIAAGQYSETIIDPQTKTITLKPVGTVTIP